METIPGLCAMIWSRFHGQVNFEFFYGGHENVYMAIPFGLEGSINLPYNLLLSSRADYLRPMNDWTGGYVIRGWASVALSGQRTILTAISIYTVSQRKTRPRTRQRTS